MYSANPSLYWKIQTILYLETEKNRSISPNNQNFVFYLKLYQCQQNFRIMNMKKPQIIAIFYLFDDWEK